MIEYNNQSLWDTFALHGFAVLGEVAPEKVEAMRQRIDQIMLGEANIDYDRTLMQLDSEDGEYASAGPQSQGHKGRTLNYRKIEQLEFDDVFLGYMQLPIFAEVARHVYGDIPVASFRAMFMNKPAGKGTKLPLHQDRWKALDRDPLLTIYTALDDMNEENGCVELIDGSHHRVLNRDHHSGYLTEEMAREFESTRRTPLILKAGEVAILHNWTVHGSGINGSPNPRRAFSVCLMDAETRNLPGGELASTSIIFGQGALPA